MGGAVDTTRKALLDILNVKGKYCVNSFDFKLFFIGKNQIGYNHGYRKNQSALLNGSLFELRKFRSLPKPCPNLLG